MADWGPGTNTGHGHVWSRPDGMRARCGGADMCRACMADAATLAGRVEGERVPALRWEPRADGVRGSWGFSGGAVVAGVMSIPGGWLWDSVADLGGDTGGIAATPDAAKAAAEAAFRAWCERAGLVARGDAGGMVPPYKEGAGGLRPAGGNGAERGGGGGT